MVGEPLRRSYLEQYAQADPGPSSNSLRFQPGMGTGELDMSQVTFRTCLTPQLRVFVAGMDLRERAEPLEE